MTDEENHKHPVDEEDNELKLIEKKAEELKSKVQQAGQSQMPDAPEWQYQRPRSTMKQAPNDYKSLGVGMTIAYSLVGSMAVGFGLGWVIDHFAKTTIFAALGGMVGALFGIYVTFVLTQRANLDK